MFISPYTTQGAPSLQLLVTDLLYDSSCRALAAATTIAAITRILLPFSPFTALTLCCGCSITFYIAQKLIKRYIPCVESAFLHLERAGLALERRLPWIPLVITLSIVIFSLYLPPVGYCIALAAGVLAALIIEPYTALVARQ